MEFGLQGIPSTTLIGWTDYERIQGDIFDHLLAILPELGLRLYQALAVRRGPGGLRANPVLGAQHAALAVAAADARA